VQNLRKSVAEISGRPGGYQDLRVKTSLTGVFVGLSEITDAPVRATLRGESVMDGILVTGRLGASASSQCARCLRDVASNVELDICELFAASGHEPPGDHDPYRVDGLEIDLEPMLRDALGLALPLRALCRQDCPGLCARCGQDLADASCDCARDEPDPRWAALDGLREKLESRPGRTATG